MEGCFGSGGFWPRPRCFCGVIRASMSAVRKRRKSTTKKRRTRRFFMFFFAFFVSSWLIFERERTGSFFYFRLSGWGSLLSRLYYSITCQDYRVGKLIWPPRDGPGWWA